MRLLILLTAIGAAFVVALVLRWGPLSPGTAFLVVMLIASFLVFAALWWLTHDGRRLAALAAGMAISIGLAGAWAFFGPRRELLPAAEAELVGSYRMSRAEARLELSLLPDGTFTHGLLEPSPSRTQHGRWRVIHDQGKPHSTVSFDDYGPVCVVPQEQCELARYMGQALASGFYEVAEVCRVRGRIALCFNATDEYVRR